MKKHIKYRDTAPRLHLSRKLGLLDDDNTNNTMEKALKRYYDLFKTLLPAQAVEALTALFKLHNPMAADVNQALIEHGGQDSMDHTSDVGARK